jgi:hypothetical protein
MALWHSTAPASAAATPADLALGRPAVASSLASTSYPASNAVDGNLSTRWSSAFSDPQWIYLDLGSTYKINEVVLNWETAYGKAYQIQVSNDALSWTTIYSTSTGSGGVNDLTQLSGTGRYVRMYGTARGTPWGYSLWAFSVHGTPATTSPTAPSNLSARAGAQQVFLSWGASTDPDSAVAGYRVYRNGTQVAQVTSTSYTDTGLTDGTSYAYYVNAYDATGNVSAASSTVSATPATAHSYYWGALIGSQFTGAEAPWDWTSGPSATQPSGTDFSNTVAGGKSISILHFAEPWYDTVDCGGFCSLNTTALNNIRANGVIPMLDWLSEDTDSSSNNATMTDSAIAGGTQDAYITAFAEALKAWGHPLFLRFDHEMNGNWFQWGVGFPSSGNTAANYQAMWQHVHTIFTSVGATNVTWDWCPNADNSNNPSMASLYPGNSYVDWTCMDGYNTASAGNTSFQSLFQATYNNIMAVTPSKPMMIGETGTSESYGSSSKASWITNMFTALPTSFPNIRALVWYDRSSPGGYTDTMIETDSSAETAFTAGIGSSVFEADNYASLNTSPIPPA